MVRLLRMSAAVVAIEQGGRAVVAVRSQGGGDRAERSRGGSDRAERSRGLRLGRRVVAVRWRDITIMIAVR